MTRSKVLIVDDSAVVRQVLQGIFEQDPEIQVIGTASDPYIAVQKIQQERPDVITLDVEMPRMDGLSFLERIMQQHPIPVVVISSLTPKGASNAIRALELGAVEVLCKPDYTTRDELAQAALHFCEVVKAAAFAKLQKKRAAARTQLRKPTRSLLKTTEKVVAIGASTGGTQALEEILVSMPADSPGMVVVQHMPEMFTRSFAERLSQTCSMDVQEAKNGDSVVPGRVLIAPGNFHLQLRRSGARYYVTLSDGPPVNRHRPSVDVLFQSVAQHAGSNAIGVLLTGMGKDGAEGLLQIKNAGAHTIIQDKASSVVYGMPGEAAKLGAANQELPLGQIAASILRFS